MKQKMKVTKATERLSNVAMWGVILAFLLLFVLLPTKGKSDALNLSEVKEMVEIKPKNKELRRYHRNANRNFTCSLCKTKKWWQVWKKK